MTNKDYQLVAEAIRETYENSLAVTVSGRIALRTIASRLSKAFMADNPRFDPEKFIEACGL